MRLQLRRRGNARLAMRWTACLALLAAMVFPAAQVTLAVHDECIIELDGNIAPDPGACPGPLGGTDWTALFNPTPGGATRNSTPLPTGTEQASFFQRDFTLNNRGQIQPDTSYFQPSSKDFQAINPAGASDVWACTSANVADKDEIMNAYALLVDAPDAVGGGIDRFAYVGMERFDNSGNAFFGVWLFQSTVSCTPDGKFTGVKTAGAPSSNAGPFGDVLVLIDFEGGGTDPINTHIRAFEWVGSGGNALDINGTPIPQFDSLTTGAGCGAASAGDDVCAVVSTGTFLPPWLFDDKDGNDLSPNQFVEAGFNLNDLFHAASGQVPCFSTILVETRSSSSLSATLKDYVGGNFQACKPGLTTQASTNGTVTPGTAVHDTATITVTGGSNAPDPTSPPNVNFFVCGPNLSANPDCTTGGTAVGSGALVGGTPNDGIATALSPDVNTAASPLNPGHYCFRAEWDGNATYPGKISGTNTTTECFEVVSPTTTTTRQFVFPQDKAKITAVAGNLAGNVQFKLYDTLANCSANGATGLLFDSGPLAISGASPQFATTNNTSARVASDGTVYWNVVYTPTNTQTGSASSCVESTAVDFTGDDATIAIP